MVCLATACEMRQVTPSSESCSGRVSLGSTTLESRGCGPSPCACWYVCLLQ